MSVINTMLKDLDKRQQSHGLDELPVPPLQYRQAPQSRLPWLLLALLSLLLLAMGYLAWDRYAALERTNLALQQDNQNLAQEIASGDLKQPSVETIASNETALAADEAPAEESKAEGSQIADTQVTAKVEPSADASAELVATPKIAPVAEPKDESKPAVESTPAAKPQRVRVKQASDANTAKTTGSMVVTEVKLSPEALAEKRFSQGKSAQEGGQLSQAVDDYSEAIRLDPTLHGARQYLAALYYGQGQLGEAKTVLQQGLARYPQEFDYALMLAKVLEAQGDSQGALAALGTIPDDHLLAKQKWVLKSHLAQQASEFALAEESYRRLAKVEPTQAKWWMGLAYALDSQQKYTSAKQAYAQALGLSGLSQQASDFIQQRLAQLGDIE
ncbi:tetratricopeptide repeat protein [Shewanella alkalitolerans]|uniref:tetratricopeptide repeat protein n=1 Tax=Shewanella alkalitolerans TaxID=2864209 RepID=UPI001C660C5B|nr:tetratricopeptide repeat protein [Shewanella alkalitolerans]QYJ98048.1 tetratricopeptide repeat protein [Shewanella alkalitolerans]